MSDTVISPGNYRIEVSGWGLNDDFFVENTDLLWNEGGEKRLLLHQALLEQAVIFVRLTGPEHTHGSVPIAYQVADVRPMNSIGLREA